MLLPCRHRHGRRKRKGLRNKLKGLFGGSKEEQTGAWGEGERGTAAAGGA
jgi:hypothetical protein